MTLVVRMTSLLLVMACLAGCALPLPEYEMMSTEEARRVMAERFRSVCVVRTVGRLTMTSSDGRRTSADFAAVHDRSQMKLRIWKLSTVVYDLTVTNDGVWVYDALKDRDSTGALDFHDIHQAWRLLMGSFFLGPAARVRSLDNATITYELQQGFETTRCAIDRRLLVPRTYTIIRRSNEALSMELSRYRMTEGMAWPTRMTLSGPTGHIQIRFSDISFSEIDTTAIFKPSRRAERLR